MISVKPHFVVKPKNTTAYEGYPAILHCVVEGNPHPNIEWDKNNVVDGFNQERFKVSSYDGLIFKILFLFIKD